MPYKNPKSEQAKESRRRYRKKNKERVKEYSLLTTEHQKLRMKIVPKCEGCKRVCGEYCKTYLMPESKWRLGKCPMATNQPKKAETRAEVNIRKAFAGKRSLVMLRYGMVGYRFGPKITNPSHTPGSTKGGVCQANSVQRYMASRSRSYKHRNYGQWIAWADKINKR